MHKAKTHCHVLQEKPSKIGPFLAKWLQVDFCFLGGFFENFKISLNYAHDDVDGAINLYPLYAIAKPCSDAHETVKAALMSLVMQ